MTYNAIYENPWNRDGISEEGTICKTSVNLHVSTNIPFTDEQVREVLRQHLRERFKITDIDEDKIHIE